MEKLRLYFLNDDYISYLRNFDCRVAYNKKQKRPYVGIVYQYNGFTYFAPLSSPKEKHLKINSHNVDIYKIDDGKLGVVNLNNMIPVPKETLIDVFSKNINDIKYRKLLENQVNLLNIDKEYLYKKVNRFQGLYRNHRLPEKIMNRTCDFELLEIKCKDYQKLLEEK